jgi:tyrosyl-tRNA synthetase
MANLSLFETLQARGLVAQCTGEAPLRALLDSTEQVTLYVGYDPTGDSLHVGHLVTLMVLRHLAAAGHRPVVIVGGGTAMVGDPSGKSEMRPMLEANRIAENVTKITGQIQRVLGSDQEKLVVVNNKDWLMGLSYIEFLRDIGKHFSVNRMLAMDAYKQRLATGLSFIEFNYQLLQAYDYLQLNDRYQCQIQLGGDDQWGNILAGVDLCRRVRGVKVEGLTVPLLTTASGAKMGKTAQGAIWLDAEKLSPHAYYQFWINCEDGDVVRFLRIFTLFPLAELQDDVLRDAPINVLKSILAHACCALVHGHAAADAAHLAAQGAFGGRQIPKDVIASSPIPRDAQSDASAIPSHALSAQDLEAGMPIVDVLLALGWCKSKNEARRLVSQGGVRVAEQAISDAGYVLQSDHFVDGSVILRAGKKRVCQLQRG